MVASGCTERGVKATGQGATYPGESLFHEVADVAAHREQLVAVHSTNGSPRHGTHDTEDAANANLGSLFRHEADLRGLNRLHEVVAESVLARSAFE